MLRNEIKFSTRLWSYNLSQDFNSCTDTLGAEGEQEDEATLKPTGVHPHFGDDKTALTEISVIKTSDAFKVQLDFTQRIIYTQLDCIHTLGHL